MAMEKCTVFNPTALQSVDIKLIIPDNILYKIQQWCAHIPDREWSGVLFYKAKGDFKKALTLTCKDIYVCDIGKATVTEFCHNADIIRYADEHDLLDCFHGILHSHNVMNTFFSLTDLNTLQEQGKQMPHFLSLIVNNRMEMKAKITRKVYYKASHYKTFRGKDVKFNFKNTETNIIEQIQNFDVNIEMAGNNDIIKEIESRIVELYKENIVKYPKCELYSENMEKTPNLFTETNTEKPVIYPDAFGYSEDDFNQTLYEDLETEIPEPVFEDLIAKIFTCNPAATSDEISEFDIPSLERNYDSLFNGNLKAVRDFLMGYLYFLINYVKEDPASDEYIRPADVCDQIVDFMKDLNPENKYVKIIIDILTDYYEYRQ